MKTTRLNVRWKKKQTQIVTLILARKYGRFGKCAIRSLGRGDLRRSWATANPDPSHGFANGKRIPGLKLDHPPATGRHACPGPLFLTGGRQHIHHHRTASSCFAGAGALAGRLPTRSLRYDLRKLRAKGLIKKDPSFPPLSAAAQRLPDSVWYS